MNKTKFDNIDDHENTTSVTPGENEMEYQQENVTTYRLRNLDEHESKKDNEKVVLNNIANKYGNVHQKNHPIGHKLKFEVVDATENHELEDLNADELKFRSEPNSVESKYRTSDIRDIEVKNQCGNLEDDDAVCLSSTLLCKDVIHESRSSLMSESPNKSLDKKFMFSVQDKAANLR